jgi:hypothetical protein
MSETSESGIRYTEGSSGPECLLETSQPQQRPESPLEEFPLHFYYFLVTIPVPRVVFHQLATKA